MRTTHLIARLLWIVPVVLVLLALNQVNAAYDLRHTWENGTPARAEVLAFDKTNRVEITYGYVNLRATLPDGRVIEKEKMSLPTTLLSRVEGEQELDVRVLPEADQEVVIDALMPAQWLIAAAQAAISLVGAIFLGAGIFWWNRYLKENGDPADRPPEEAEERAYSGVSW